MQRRFAHGEKSTTESGRSASGGSAKTSERAVPEIARDVRTGLGDDLDLLEIGAMLSLPLGTSGDVFAADGGMQKIMIAVFDQ